MSMSSPNQAAIETTRRLDRIGARTSTLCALHCAVMPMVATSLPLVGLEWLTSPVVEGLLIALGLGVASVALLRGYLRHHRRAEALVIGMAGGGSILATRLGLPEELEPVGMAAGGSLLALAHLTNSRLCSRCCRLDQ